MEHKYTGIILNKKDIGEADRLYTFYTLEQGKIKAIARGVRKPHAKLAGHLENFCLVDFTVMKNKGMGNIASSIVENNYSSMRDDFDALKSIFEAVKMFDSMVNEGERDQEVFHLLWQYLEAIGESPKDCEIISQGFYFKLFHLLGYGVSPNFCVCCQKKIRETINYFDYQSGGVSCAECAKKISNKIVVSGNAVKLMRIFSSNRLNSLVKLKISQKDLNILRSVSLGFFRWIV